MSRHRVENLLGGVADVLRTERHWFGDTSADMNLLAGGGGWRAAGRVHASKVEAAAALAANLRARAAEMIALADQLDGGLR